MFGFLKKRFTGSSNRYFWFGMKHLVGLHSAFAREIALEDGMNFVRHHGLKGDYLEFGVFKGRTFSAACALAQARNLGMHFWAFDSFEGLPVAEGEFGKSSWNSGLEVFLTQARRHLRDPSRLHVVKGWFAESLREANPDLAGLSQVAIAWVDCDIYESTVPVLDFLTARLQEGSLIYFDDWFCLKGNPHRGEQRACQEWLRRNPQIRLVPYSRFGWHGQSFIVNTEF